MIQCLMKNGRITWAELASQVNLSSPAAEQGNRLIRKGVIQEIGANFYEVLIEIH